MDRKFWDEVHSRVNRLRRLEATYTENSIDVLTSYAGTAAAIATSLSGPTTKYLGKRTRAEEEDTEDTVEESENATIDNTENETVKDTIPSGHDDEQLSGVKNAIFQIGYKKLLGKQLSENDSQLLQQITDNPMIDLQPPLAKYIAHILKGELCYDDVLRLKLSLSGIVNTIRPNDFDIVRPFLPQINFTERLDTLVNTFRKSANTREMKNVIKQIVDEFEQGASIEDTIILIHDLQRPFLRSKQCDNQVYRALEATTHILKFMHSYKNSDSEATVLRSFMTILTCVFSKASNIVLIEGETTSSCTKSIKRFNEALYDTNRNQIVGRKIDILIKHDKGDSGFIELSSLEIKPTNTTAALVKEQQNKNLRTNGAILA